MPISCRVLNNKSQEISPKKEGSFEEYFTFVLKRTIDNFNGTLSEEHYKMAQRFFASRQEKISYSLKEEIKGTSFVQFFAGMTNFSGKKNQNMFPSNLSCSQASFKGDELKRDLQNLGVSSKTIDAILEIFRAPFQNNLKLSEIFSTFKQFISELKIEGIKEVIFSGELENEYIEEQVEEQEKIPKEVQLLIEKYKCQEYIKHNSLKLGLERLLRNLVNKDESDDLAILLTHVKTLDLDISARDTKVKKNAFDYAKTDSECYKLLEKAKAESISSNTFKIN
jgi:hypothetical protein